jgi:peptide/nickel transport system permease protein
LPYEALRAELGLDRPVPVQYWRWASRALTGDFGLSTRNKQPVSEAIAARLAPTLQLTVMSLMWALAIGIPVGIISAMRPNSLRDIFGSIFAVAGVAVPSFWLGVMLILVVGVWLKWLPPMGYVSPFEDLTLNLKLMLMPSLTLSAWLTAVVMRQVRSSLLEVMQQDYVRTARAKGLGEWKVVTRHAMKNALIPWSP